jgi:hypothetical protein
MLVTSSHLSVPLYEADAIRACALLQRIKLMTIEAPRQPCSQHAAIQ